ncbi:hypothetical protein [Stutzerimonas kunmingensis]|uniref:hypothetical protein n=1 Tax=Stutzerimonas kunmingensis TaxID=1211807 RepID=UPI00052D2CFD|nr:hypothetical protein [Stutzerimonas kunmingensis]CEG54285.1 hypothetical protein PXNS11_350005 [Stutzerimonas xanthomarina]
MKEGNFYRKKLSDYINSVEVDYVEARRIINGSDQHQLIAGYARKLESILRKTSSAKKSFAP